MPARRLTLAALLAGASLTLTAWAAEPPERPNYPPVKAGASADADLVKRVLTERKAYQQSLIALYDHYTTNGDKERARWVEDELKAYHLAFKPSYRLDIQDVPPPTLEPKTNIKEANDLFKMATAYKAKGGVGNDYVLNQRRAEVLLQDILQKYPESDKIADVAYELGDLYEGKAYKQYDRAAAYYERAYQWRRGTRTDARLRAARLYDKTLNDRTKAIELYREEIATDTDPTRIKEAEKRLAELAAGR